MSLRDTSSRCINILPVAIFMKFDAKGKRVRIISKEGVERDNSSVEVEVRAKPRIGGRACRGSP